MQTKNNNEKVPKKKEPNKAVAVIIFIGLIIFILYLSGVFKSEKEEPIAVVSTETDFKNAVKRIFGQPKGSESSGVVKIIYSESESAVHYNFYPVGLFKYENELGVELASEIRKLYEVGGKFNNITFQVNGLFQDKYGKSQWLRILSFEFTKSIYNRINWDNFLDQDLLKVVQNVKWFRREAIK
jgi:hypothetical protein